MDLPYLKPLLIASVLTALWVGEGLAPMFTGHRRRLGHDLRNLALGLINAAVVAFAFAGLLLAAMGWSQREGFGLLHRFDGPPWLEWAAAIVLFDLWMYIWHVANHKVPLLWRFHQVHHADAQLDASSALRFHTGEIVLSSIARLGVAPLLGMTGGQLLLYELILQPIILLHHANVRFPAALDRALRLVIVTPRIHWVHHSKLRAEHDANYASVLSWWDRVFRTLRWKNPQDIEIGLTYTGEHETRELGRMLAMPFRSMRNAKGLSRSPRRDDGHEADPR